MLEIKNISKSFKLTDSRMHSVLTNISYTFPNKGLFFVLGKSGSGKSTLMNIMAGLLKPDSGEIFYNGKELSKFTKKDKQKYLKDDIGILFQRFNLLEGISLEDNINIAKWIKNPKDEINLDELLKTYGLIKKKKQDVSSLSGGERQRLALVRALVSKPKILFCDEPTGALDNENSRLLFSMLKELSNEILIIVITHNKELFKENYDGYLMLENGAVKEKVGEKEDEIINDENKVITKSNEKFTTCLATRNIKKNYRRNLINAFSAAFSLIVFVISTFFSNGLANNKTYLVNTYGDKNSFKVSKTLHEEIENSPIGLVKNERPTHEEIHSLLGDQKVLVNYSYDFFFKGTKTIEVKDKILGNFIVKPFYDPSLKSNEVIVNQFLADEIGTLKKGDYLKLKVKTSYQYLSDFTNKNISEDFYVEPVFEIGGVVEEFSYMNQPTLYYSTNKFEEILRNTKALKSSEDRNEDTNFYQLVEEAKNNSDISDYSLMVFSYDDESSDLLRRNIQNGSKKYTVENIGYQMVESFTSIAESVFLGVNIFIGLALITTLFVNGFLGYSSAILNRKESAILSCLGASDEEINRIYLYEQFIFMVLGVMIGLFISVASSFILNKMLSSFFINPNLIILDWIFIILSLICFILINILAIYIPLTFMKKKSIVEELKEE